MKYYTNQRKNIWFIKNTFLYPQFYQKFNVLYKKQKFFKIVNVMRQTVFEWRQKRSPFNNIVYKLFRFGHKNISHKTIT